MGHQILVANGAERGALCEVVHHGVVLHFAEADEVDGTFLVGSGNHLAHPLQFLEESALVPSPFASVAILGIHLPCIVDGVESVLDVVGHNRKKSPDS